jgi:glycosyltransferase involved in cell wall biosynthesis
MNTPKVSVSLITYNHARYVAQAIESVLAQVIAFPFELIIGEDDSDDGTRDIVQEYARRHPEKIRLNLHSRASNISYGGRPTSRHNFVTNIRSATGEYVAMIDGDDFWSDPEKLQRQVEFLDSHPGCSVCFHRVTIVNEEGNEIGKMPLVGPDQSTFTLADLLRRRFFAKAPSVMFRRGLFGEFPEWYFRCPVSDFPLHVLNGLRGDFGYLAKEMGAYRIHAGGIWSANNAMSDLDTASVDPRKVRQLTSVIHMYQILEEALAPRCGDELREGIAFYGYQLAHLYRHAEDWRALRSTLWTVWKSRPFPREVSYLSLLALLAQGWCPPVAKLTDFARKYLPPR